jgi:hypothetical protein
VLVILGVVVAVAAAVRSTWSPCGLSMLSTVTPLAEAGRGRRYGVTVAWFVAGATLGGVTLGAAAAMAAAGVGVLDLGTTQVLAAVAVAAALTAASDCGSFGFRLPWHTRQVNERWLDQYRAWVYGGGFGWQIGVGLATYITTAAVYLLVAVAALTASPMAAFALCVLFGVVRGLAVLLGARLSDPERLRRFHRRFVALAEPVRLTVIGVQFVVVLGAGAAAGGLTGAVAATVAVALVLAGTSLRAGAAPRAMDTGPARRPPAALNG